MLNNTANAQDEKADATITLSRDVLNNLLLKQTTFEQAVAAGDIKINGNADKLKEVLSYLDNFEFWFNIVTHDQAISSTPALRPGPGGFPHDQGLRL